MSDWKMTSICNIRCFSNSVMAASISSTIYLIVRRHRWSAVRTGSHPRYSVFGAELAACTSVTAIDDDDQSGDARILRGILLALAMLNQRRAPSSMTSSIRDGVAASLPAGRRALRRPSSGRPAILLACACRYGAPSTGQLDFAFPPASPFGHAFCYPAHCCY